MLCREENVQLVSAFCVESTDKPVRMRQWIQGESWWPFMLLRSRNVPTQPEHKLQLRHIDLRMPPWLLIIKPDRRRARVSSLMQGGRDLQPDESTMCEAVS